MPMQKTEEPLVSILMNCFNGEIYLREALKSILAQTYQNWELIFWDNQSTDQSADIFKSYKDDRLKYYYSPKHTNLGGGRAKAYPLLRGEFIAILDTDDLWLPNKLEEQLKCFDDENIGISITNTEFFSKKRSKVLYKKPPTQGWVTNELLKNYYISLETVMLRCSFVQSLEYAFDPDFSHIADFDLIVRTSTVSKLAYIPKVLAKWRVHDASLSHASKEVFVFEKKKWLLKNGDKPNFASYQKALNTFKNNTEIQWIRYLLTKSRINEAKKTLNNIRFDTTQAYIVYVLSFVPVLTFIIRLRDQMQRSYWF